MELLHRSVPLLTNSRSYLYLNRNDCNVIILDIEITKQRIYCKVFQHEVKSIHIARQQQHQKRLHH